MVRTRALRWVGAVAALALALSGVLVFHARKGNGAPRAASQVTPPAGEPSSPDTITGSGAASSVPDGLLNVSPGEAGANLPTFNTAGTVATSSWIAHSFPQQAAATQTSDPASRFWAVLIGLNDYAGNTADNVGSRQDAQSLRDALLRLGWRSDHILLVTDRAGTASHIIDSIRWLASKTNSASTAVFHYSGHENWTRTTADGDNESRDVEIWAADNRLIIDGTVGREMNRVRAGRMWIDFATCRAAGFNDAGMIKSGRILTYSSPVNEFSYEDPRLHHSVFGYFMITMAIYNKKADANHDGRVSIEEAFAYAKPRVVSYTSSYQHPVMGDHVSGSMFLTIPAAPVSSSTQPRPSPTPDASTSPKACVFVCF